MKILIKHCGGIGDFVFLVPPIIEILKNRYPNCHITVVTAWGMSWKNSFTFAKKIPFIKRNKCRFFGNRNQGGYCISLIAQNPYVNEIVHWHNTQLSLDKKVCIEDNVSYVTWNSEYFKKIKQSGEYDKIYEIDKIGLDRRGNPIKKVLKTLGEEESDFSHYRIYTSVIDQRKISDIIKDYPHPRILICEGIEKKATRSWTKEKVDMLIKLIKNEFKVDPIWFGSKEIPEYFYQPLSLREQVEFARQCDIAIGIISAPLHLAASAGLQTITLFGNFSLERAEIAYHLNKYVKNENEKHITIYANDCKENPCYIKPAYPCRKIVDLKNQSWKSWSEPGRQETKSCIARISVEEVFETLKKALKIRGLVQ